MTYLALARKWRPKTFAQLVGQPAISKAITQSLDKNRLHHAYLFAGTRGVGKTSIARLMAKAVNCEQGISSNPCQKCTSCISLEHGAFVDLIEIDAASRTKVEDTRALLDNVHYLPTSGRYKIYLIDEVHMLSQHSFNALLKTLEEPPEHVLFLLATTDPQKLPVTVLSRCLQFNLKALDAETITQQLEKIMHEEQLSFEKPAIALIAKAARGSMRDALSLLDQAIASMDKTLIAPDVKAMLGYTQRDFAYELLQTLVHMDGTQLIRLCKEINQEGGHFNYVLTAILEYLHEAAMVQILPAENHALFNTSAEVQQLATQLSAEDLQLFYQIGVKGLEELPLAPELTLGFEMTLLRMYTFKPAQPSPTPPLAYTKQAEPILKKNNEPTTGVEEKSIPVAQTPTLITVTEQPKVEANAKDWPLLIQALQLSGLALNALENAVFIEKVEGTLSLKVTKGHQALFTPATQARIEQSLQNYYQEPIKIQLKIDDNVSQTPAQMKAQELIEKTAEAQTQLQQDPFFNQITQKFSAELVKNSIEVLKDPL